MSKQTSPEFIATQQHEDLFRRHPERFSHSPHWNGQKFVNLETGERNVKAILTWLRTRQPSAWPCWVDNPVFAAPAPRHSPQLDQWHVHFINHATVLWQIGPYNLLTDPVFSERVSPFRFAGPRRVRAPGIALQDLPPIDIVLLSHNHYDHMDIASLRYLHERDHPQLITGLGNAHYLRRQGIDAIHELDWWQSLSWKGLRIHYVPSQHFSGRGLRDRDQALWGGMVVETAQGCGYFAGDTGWGRHFHDIAERWPAFRLSLLPIGAYEPRWFMRLAHINPEEAVRAHKLLRSSVSLAIHHNTFQLTDEPMNQPVLDLQIALQTQELEPEKFWVLAEGEGRDVPPL